jgi:ubiquinone/menaquinone biosynthesis C-methylase UbiE
MTTREQVTTAYQDISIGGGDTSQRINLSARLALIERHVPLLGRKVIDCGCGSGGYVLEFLKWGADAFGVEYSEEKVCRFKQLGRDPDRVKAGRLEQIDFPDATFDLALLNEVLEHVPNEQKALNEINRILKPRGMLAIFSPNRFYPFETHGVRWKRSRRGIPPHRTLLVPYIPLRIGNHFWEYWARNYFPSELRRMVREAGFEVVHCTYLWQTFENISGSQPAFIRALRPLLRQISFALEHTPLLRVFGASQVIFSRKR